MKELEDLRVWHVALALVQMTWAVTARMRDDGGLRQQMRCAAVSVASNIAEGDGRKSDNEMRNFLRYARASCHELRVQAQIARCTGADTTSVEAQCDSCGRMLTRLIQSLSPP